MKNKIQLRPLWDIARQRFQKTPLAMRIGLITIVASSAYFLASRALDDEEQIVETPASNYPDGGTVINSSATIHKRKNRKLEKQIQKLQAEQKIILDNLRGLTAALDDYKNRQQAENTQNESHNATAESTQYSQPPEPSRVPQNGNVQSASGSTTSSASINPQAVSGPSVISFPTESTKRSFDRIHLSPGSFVETVLLSGVQATNGKPYPVLLKAIQSFIGPNKTRVDLSGCFILGKAKGNLSLSRVEIQPYKLACTAKSGRLFERDLNGFVADKTDNSFGVVGEVDLKADSRLATLTFLSSMIEGIGRNIERLQTKTTQTESGSSTSVTGNEGRYIVAGGAASAANKMTQFFLRHAENLLPTINIHSSQKIYVVIQDSVDLPSWYFKRTKKKGNDGFAYLSRLID